LPFDEKETSMKYTLVRISLSAMTLLAAPGLLATDCFPAANNGYLVPFSMVTLKNFSWGSQYASYVKGNMAISVTNTLSEKGITLSSSQETQLFSDRIFAVPTWNGFVNQPFSVNYPDTVAVSVSNVTNTYSRPINPDPSAIAGGAVTLLSYGRTTIFGVSCNATTGELYGAASSDTFVVITFGTPQAPGQF
jgi:hypothetical protein